MTQAGPPIDVAIVDPCCAAGYTPASQAEGALGGTEATVLRVAGELSLLARVVHFQRNRVRAEVTRAGLMRPLADVFRTGGMQTIVVINSWKVACKLRKAHPAARILLWLHIYPGRHNRPMAAALRDADIEIICVSRAHAARLRDFLQSETAPRVEHIYNPIAARLWPDATPRDPHRLLFASSPHKGLAQVYAQFDAARARMPELTLAVADPGYLAWNTGPAPDGVTFLGTLSHADLIAQMRRASCLFYPQTSFAETFGLVLAEANAVGLPVLVHRGLGANDEVLGDSAQLVDGRDMDEIVDRLRHWRNAPPAVAANPAFRLDTIAREWAGRLRIGHSTRQVA